LLKSLSGIYAWTDVWDKNAYAYDAYYPEYHLPAGSDYKSVGLDGGPQRGTYKGHPVFLKVVIIFCINVLMFSSLACRLVDTVLISPLDSNVAKCCMEVDTVAQAFAFIADKTVPERQFVVDTFANPDAMFRTPDFIAFTVENVLVASVYLISAVANRF